MPAAAETDVVRQFAAAAAAGGFSPVAELFPPALESIFPPDYVQHEPNMAPGVEGVRAFLAAATIAFPDLRGRVDDVIAGGDRVVVRMTWEGTHRGPFAGVAATGRPVRYERIEIWRVDDSGRLAEHWGAYDLYGLLRQLDAVPAVVA